MDEVHDLLERATDRIEAPHLAPRALLVARGRRTRRRGGIAAAAVAVAVAAVLLLPRGDQEQVRPAGPPAKAEIITGTAPAMEPDVIQALWDPAEVVSLPRGATVPAGELLLDDRVGDYQLWGGATIPRPGGLGVQATSALSRDGQQVAAVGVNGLWVRPVTGGEWQNLAVPRQVSGEGVAIDWVDSVTLLLSSWKGAWRIDLATGGAEKLPGLGEYPELAVDADGGYAAVLSVAPGLRLGQWRADGERWSSTATGPLESVQRMALSDTSIAATKGDYLAEEQRAVTDRDGVVALDRDGLTTRAFLPVTDTDTWYSDNGGITALAWLDDDTVLLSVVPEPPGQALANTRYLVTWNVETGDLTLAGTTPATFAVSVAQDTIAR